MDYKKQDDPSTLAKKMGFQDSDLKTPKHDEIMLWLDANVEEVVNGLDSFGANYKSHELYEKRWEKVISTRTGFSVGFIDMWVTMTVTRTVAWEGSKELQWDQRHFAFEVKSSVPSLGELIRQIRFMQEHVNRNGPDIGPIFFVVVSPDDRFAEQIRAQGIRFVKSPP